MKCLFRWCCALAPGALLLAACSTPAPVARVDAGSVDTYRSAGYPMNTSGSFEARRISAPATDAPWTITVARPGGQQALPVIVYLPGLGESDDVPCQWIRAWAKAGFAVIVVQALADDAAVWTSPEARSGDFDRIGRARFSADLMDDRLARLSVILREVKLRSQRGEAGLDGLDWTHLALAGADLGAYTVQAIARSSPRRLEAISWPITPLAYVAISPYAVRGSAEPPPASAHAPVLMISSSQDTDAYGVVTDPSVRRLAFDQLGEGDDFYLELAAVSHRWLSGYPPAAPAASGAPARPMFQQALEGRNRGPQQKGQPRDSMAPGGEEEETPEEKSAHNASLVQQVEMHSRALTHLARSEITLEDVSIAFFDGTLRQQQTARSWLGTAAAQWLQSGDRLKHR